MSEIEPLLRYWRAQDDLFLEITPTAWGAVVTDPRYPEIHDVNYARIEISEPDLSLADVEADLLPALGEVGVPYVHTVLFHPEGTTRLLVEASTRGDRITWDAVFRFTGPPPRSGDGPDEEEVQRLDDAFWDGYRDSLRLFGIASEEARRRMEHLEREVMVAAGKRWFVVREHGQAVAWGSLLVLDGVGHIDHVATYPEARRRGYGTAITRRLTAEALAAGAREVILLADPDGAARGIYERLGFRPCAQLASTLRPRRATSDT